MAHEASVERTSEGDDWVRLQRDYVELRIAVQQETDHDRRAGMIDRLRRTRKEIDDLDEAKAVAAEAELARSRAESEQAAASRAQPSTVARDRALSLAGSTASPADEAGADAVADVGAAVARRIDPIGDRRILLILAVSITVAAIGLILYGALAGDGDGGSQPVVSTGVPDLDDAESGGGEINGIETGGGGVDRGDLMIALVLDAGGDPAAARALTSAVQDLADEAAGVEVVTTRAASPDDVLQAVSGEASDGHDLVVVHGSELSDDLRAVIAANPDTAFAWAADADIFDLPNLYTLDAASEQGGYVLGALSAYLTSSDVIGVVGSAPDGEAGRYVDAFHDAAHAESSRLSVIIGSTGSPADIARSHVAKGADVLTGTGDVAEAVLGATAARDVVWLAPTEDLRSTAPSRVAASVVYDWEPALAEVMADIASETVAGRPLTLTLANGGLTIDYNNQIAIPAEARARADQLVEAIVDGSLVVG